jgi:hypothetical protein
MINYGEYTDYKDLKLGDIFCDYIGEYGDNDRITIIRITELGQYDKQLYGQEINYVRCEEFNFNTNDFNGGDYDDSCYLKERDWDDDPEEDDANDIEYTGRYFKYLKKVDANLLQISKGKKIQDLKEVIIVTVFLNVKE